MTISDVLEGRILAEGKTKIIREIVDQPGKALVGSKDDITAGDGKKHDIIGGKAGFSNRTTCNVFRLLAACGIPVAFIQQLSLTTFMAWLCQMLPYEVVIRRAAHGSYLKRAPHLLKGHLFPQLVLEFYLKTSGRKWKSYDLICDDPLMVYDGVMISLYDPKQPNLAQAPAKPFLILPVGAVFTRDDEPELMEKMGQIARRTFLILEKAWQIQGRELVDFKVEFGLDVNGKLLLADVIDNDSWRILESDGSYGDKQVYRDGGDLDTVTAKYKLAAELTDRFTLPAQCLILWRGSDKDDFKPYYDAVKKLCPSGHDFEIKEITCSAHKQPARAYRELQEALQKSPDSVIIAAVGLSNGAGPILSANATVPVITVPATYKEFPEDVWSSIRTPSSVPVMTVLNPENAVLAALKILAMRNPGLYAVLRLEQEIRLTEI